MLAPFCASFALTAAYLRLFDAPSFLLDAGNRF
jgi:hypothetical protein